MASPIPNLKKRCPRSLKRPQFDQHQFSQKIQCDHENSDFQRNEKDGLEGSKIVVSGQKYILPHF